MKLIIFFGLLFCIILLLIFALYNDIKKRYHSYCKSISSQLSDMFIDRIYTCPLNQKNIQKILLTIMIFFGGIGFFIPGTYSQIEIKYACNKAMKHNSVGQYHESYQTLKHYIALNSPIIQHEIGVACMGLSRYDQAESSFKSAIKLLPQYSKAHYNLSLLYKIKGKDLKASFEQTRAKETSGISFNEKDYYGISFSFFDKIVLRILFAICFMLLILTAPKWIIPLLKKRRIRKYDEQLSNGLMILSSSLAGGLTVPDAIQVAIKETPAPFSQEVGNVLSKYLIKPDLVSALRHLEKRMPTIDNKIFVSAIIIQRGTGIDLVQLFDIIYHTIEERKRIKKKIKGMMASTQVQANTLAVLPVGMGFMMNYAIPDIFCVMYTTIPGIILLILMILMDLGGLYWMMKISKIKV